MDMEMIKEMEKIIKQLRGKVSAEQLEKLFAEVCYIYGENPDDSGLFVFEDDDIKDWVYNKHPELIEQFEEGLQRKDFFYEDYIYALCRDDCYSEEEIIQYIAMYYSENPKMLSKLADDLESDL